MIRRYFLGFLMWAPAAALARPRPVGATSVPRTDFSELDSHCICTSPAIRARRERDDRLGRKANYRTRHDAVPSIMPGELIRHPLPASLDEEMAVFPVGHGWVDVRGVYRDFRPPGPVGYFAMASPNEYEVIHTRCSFGHPITLLHFRHAKNGERQPQLSFDDTCHTIFVDGSVFA